MIIGQTIFAGTYYSPWFPRQGNAGVFSGEIIASNLTGTLVIYVETKNLEDTDTSPGTLTGGSMVWSGLSNTVASSGSASGAKELVRFKYVYTSATNGWIHLRVLPPSWQQN